MPAIQLTIAERKAHRAEAHHLDPVVMMEVFGRREGILCGIDEAKNLLGHVLANAVLEFPGPILGVEHLAADLAQRLALPGHFDRGELPLGIARHA